MLAEGLKTIETIETIFLCEMEKLNRTYKILYSIVSIVFKNHASEKLKKYCLLKTTQAVRLLHFT